MKKHDLKIEVGVHSSAGSRTLKDGRPKLNLDRYLIKSYDTSSAKSDEVTLAMIADTWSHSFRDEDWNDSHPPSQIVIDKVAKSFARIDNDDLLLELQSALQQAPNFLQQMTNAGVTCVAVIIKDSQLYVASAGDCRAFLLRNGEAIQITVVHTLAERLIEIKEMTSEDFENVHYNAKSPYRALGHTYSTKYNNITDLRLRLTSDDDDETALANQGLQLLDGDQIVLTSGGTYRDWITRAELEQFKKVFFNSEFSGQEAVDRFIQTLRKENDFSDMTVLTLRFTTP